jgi:hypothetical protein
MRHRFAFPALVTALVLLVAGCAADPPADQGAAGPATTADAGPDPTTAPSTTRKAPPATRPAPEGVVPAGRRVRAPDLAVTAFDGRTITLGGFRGQPVVVNFFESW